MSTTHEKRQKDLGFLAGLLSRAQLLRSAIIIRPSTVLKIHRAIVNAKYNLTFNPPTRSGPKGPSQKLIDLIIETKLKNPHMGCLQIAQLIALNFNFTIDQNTVHRILRKHLPSAGPSRNHGLLFWALGKIAFGVSISFALNRRCSKRIG